MRSSLHKYFSSMSLGAARSKLNHTCQRTFRSFFTIKQESSERLKAKEKKYLAHIYEPVPVVICRGEGCYVWDPEGKQYMDFLAAFGALNLGHCHPKALKVLREQAKTLTLTSRAYYNTVLPEFAEYLSQYLQYDKVIPMNTGAEAGETAVKIARRWGYLEKKIPQGRALIVFPEGNFWGRTTAAISTSTNPVVYENFGPFMPGFGLIPYNDCCALETVLKKPEVCAYFMEPIQGENGVVIPCPGYLKEVRRLCTENNVLWIADEVQTGLGRTGQLLACDHECVKPDILLLGKGLAAGLVPGAAVLGNDSVMKVMTPSSHGSTWGGNPLACKLGIATLNIIQEEGLVTNAAIMGEKLKKMLCCQLPKEVVPEIRGRGLMMAFTVNTDVVNAYDFCTMLKDQGILAKNTDDCTVRLTPPLIVKEADITRAADIIFQTVQKIRGCP